MYSMHDAREYQCLWPMTSGSRPLQAVLLPGRRIGAGLPGADGRDAAEGCPRAGG